MACQVDDSHAENQQVSYPSPGGTEIADTSQGCVSLHKPEPCQSGFDEMDQGALAWQKFAQRQPTLIALDVHLHHMLGERLEELSMAQLSELMDVQRGLVLKLEEARVSLVQRVEREVVEERMIQEFERHMERHNIKLGS